MITGMAPENFHGDVLRRCEMNLAIFCGKVGEKAVEGSVEGQHHLMEWKNEAY